jgi:hypothetical protein
MNFSELMTYYDYKVINIMRALCLSRTTIKSWQDENHIPFKTQCYIEVLTGGKLKANLEDKKQ